MRREVVVAHEGGRRTPAVAIRSSTPTFQFMLTCAIPMPFYISRATQILPNYRGKPCSPLEFLQNAGDVVFVPQGWIHAVLNVQPVVGIAQQIGHPRDYARPFR